MKIGSLNVSGLKRRFNIPEFLETINQYDILCISETHIDSHDLVDIPDHVFISLPRSKDYRRKSGGIGIYVRTCLSKFVTFYKSSNEYVQWVTVDKAITSLSEHFADTIDHDQTEPEVQSDLDLHHPLRRCFFPKNKFEMTLFGFIIARLH